MIRTREDLCNQAKGIAAELGVAAGNFSDMILQNLRIELLYSIDRWNDRSHLDAEHQSVIRRLSKFGKRSIIMRASFEEVVHKFSDGFFNFIYIDGYAHTGQDNGRTLREWWPKVKQGGIFAGHDYHSDWQPTVDMVDEFMDFHNQKLYLTQEEHYPSWYTFKSWRNQ